MPEKLNWTCFYVLGIRVMVIRKAQCVIHVKKMSCNYYPAQVTLNNLKEVGKLPGVGKGSIAKVGFICCGS